MAHERCCTQLGESRGAAPACTAVPRTRPRTSPVRRPIRADENLLDFLLNARDGEKLQDLRNLLLLFPNALPAQKEKATA